MDDKLKILTHKIQLKRERKEPISLQTHEDLSKRAIALQNLMLQIKALLDNFLNNYPGHVEPEDRDTI